MNEPVADYDYDVPPDAVAQVPPPRREDARLLLVPRALPTPPVVTNAPAPSGPPTPSERSIRDLPAILRPGDLLVLNDARVLPARLSARREGTGGRVSVLVLRAEPRAATVLLGARGTLKAGESLAVAGDTWRLRRDLGEGRFEIDVVQGRDIRALLADAGRMPLPPYIDRDPEADARDALDRERYQTVFADGTASAVAAPTAGLHFTPALLEAVAGRGVAVERLRLDVGEGTFRPLRGATLDEHVMHAEDFVIPDALAARFAATRAAGGRVVAVGTTVVRALESAVAADGATLRPGAARTSLFIRPGHAFRAVDALLTNFHQPRSTLLVLVSAFAGRETIRAAYAHALSRGWRLFSYGDAMLIG